MAIRLKPFLTEGINIEQERLQRMTMPVWHSQRLHSTRLTKARL
jgi:hypothetical protein